MAFSLARTLPLLAVSRGSRRKGKSGNSGKHQVLSPFARGLLLVPVFILWIGLSGWFETSKLSVGPEFQSRSLLTMSAEDNKTIDELPYLTPEEKIERKGGNCTPPAIEQFPEPLMDNYYRKRGGLAIHIFIAIYMFIGLAIVCDDYFVPALDRIADVLNLPPDVAGATFMAAGSSGPELATAMIGVFVAKDDIGVSGVIGSAVFNITLVIAVCALSAERALYLNWYSVCRDCTCYLICIIVLLFTIINGIVSWQESLLFLILYVFYCIGMAFNSKFESWAIDKMPVPQSWRDAVVQQQQEKPYKTINKVQNGGGGGIPMEELQRQQQGLTDPEGQGFDEPPEPISKEPEYGPFEKPRKGGLLAVIKWVIMLPLYALAKITIPDCRKEAWAKSYILTFLMAILWISMYSYLMVWMITVIGFTLGIPDTVMGLTFIAAGVSVPDALSGIAVVREGHGDMAVSNALGSNVFDILICLGLPWFISTAIVNPDEYVKVTSKGLVYSTFSLLSTIVFLIMASHFNGWKLDRKFGIILLIWYFIFMIFASLYELNVFGFANLPTCDSDF